MTVAARAEAPALADVLDPLIERRYDPVRVILRRAIERGQLPRNTDVELGVHMIMDITASRLYFTPSDASVPAIRQVFRVVLKGLGARGYYGKEAIAPLLRVNHCIAVISASDRAPSEAGLA